MKTFNPNQPFKMAGAIFDMDGTLLDSMGLWTELGQLYLQTKGKTARPGLGKTLWPMTTLESAQYLRREYGLDCTDEQITSEIGNLIVSKYRDEIQFKPGAKEFLQKLHRLGVRMCIATATDRPMVLSAIKRLGAQDYFCGVITCTEVGCGKEQPKVYDRALEMLGTPKEETVIFEDAVYAVRTAKAAGYAVAGVEDQYSAVDWDEIRDISDWYLRSLMEFPL